jgi:AcrR family transcriptional regulator
VRAFALKTRVFSALRSAAGRAPAVGDQRVRISDPGIRFMQREARMQSDRKESLLKIGERLFAQHGYREVSIKDITSSAGLGMGSFYTYFPSKEAFYSDILDAIEERGIREVEKRVNSFQSPIFRMKALFRYTTLSLRTNEILRGIYNREKRYVYPGLEERSTRPNALFQRIEMLIDEILTEGSRRGMFRTSLFRNPRRLLIAIFTSLPLVARGHDADDLAEDVMVLVERGLRRWLRFRQRDERLDNRARRKP